MSVSPAVICAGLTTVDVIHLVEAVPPSNRKVASEDFSVAAGGPATNAAVAAARCGSPATVVTALPEHGLTDLILSDLAACDVVAHVADSSPQGPPLTAAIMVTRSTGDRAVVSPTASAVHVPPTPPDFSPAALLAGAGCVLIDGYHRHLSLPLAREARERGIPVVLDAGSHKPYTADLLAVTDIAIVSDDFAFPDADGDAHATLTRVRETGVSAAVVTRGGGPMLVSAGSDVLAIDVAPVDVVDTLGAGDFLHGAVAHRIARDGFDAARLPDDLAWASRVVGVSLRSFGTRQWLSEPLPD